MTDIQKVKILQNAHYSRLLLDLIASKWTLLVLHALQSGTKRYSEIGRLTTGITQKVLTDTLRKLERNGIIERTIHPTVPIQVEYTLTPLGYKLLEISEVMAHWAENHSIEIIRAQKAYDRQKR